MVRWPLHYREIDKRKDFVPAEDIYERRERVNAHLFEDNETYQKKIRSRINSGLETARDIFPELF